MRLPPIAVVARAIPILLPRCIVRPLPDPDRAVHAVRADASLWEGSGSADRALRPPHDAPSADSTGYDLQKPGVSRLRPGPGSEEEPGHGGRAGARELLRDAAHQHAPPGAPPGIDLVHLEGHVLVLGRGQRRPGGRADHDV